MDQGRRRAFPIAVCCLFILLYFYYVQAFGVNVPYWDEWAQVPIINAALHGRLTLAMLWAQHNENRMLFPNLIAVAFGLLAHWNVKGEMWLGAFLLTASFIVFLRSVGWRRSPWIVPLTALVWFNLAQQENILWGFQMAWYLVLLCTVLTVAWSACPDASGWQRVGAYAAAIFGSFSSLQGMLAWPCGFFVLLARRRSRKEMAAWISTAGATVAVYLYRLQLGQTGGPSPTWLLHHPRGAAQYFVAALGAVVPPSPRGPDSLHYTQLFGLGVLVLCTYVLVHWWLMWREGGDPDPVPVALVVFGLLFDVLLVLGRSAFGLQQAVSSRYATYNMVLLAGLCWSLLAAREAAAPFRSYAAGALGMILLLSIPVSTFIGVQSGRQTLSGRLTASGLLANYKTAPASLMRDYLFPSLSFLRPEAAVAQRDRLSIFATPDKVRFYQRVGVLPGGRPASPLPVPLSIRQMLKTNPTGTRAWTVLSTIYFLRPDLQNAFPRAKPPFPVNLIGWVCTEGVTVDSDRAFLLPYKTEYTAMCAALRKGH